MTAMTAMTESAPQTFTASELIINRVIKVIHQQLDVDVDLIHPHSHLIKDLGADSLDTVELVMAFEEEFELDIPDEVAEKINTVQSVVELVASKLN